MKCVLKSVALWAALLCGTSFGVTTAKAAPTTACTAFTLLNTLSDALRLEQRAKFDLEHEGQSRSDKSVVRVTIDTLTGLEGAAEKLFQFRTLLVSTSCPSGVSAVLDLCFARAEDAQSLDTYLANVLAPGVTAPGEGPRAFSSFVKDRDTQLNILNRAIEMKKDCLQALITEGVVDGSEEPPPTPEPQ